MSLGRHKTENQVRALMEAWEDAKAKGEVGEEWQWYVDTMKAGGHVTNEPPADDQGGQGRMASGNRGDGERRGDAVEQDRQDDPKADDEGVLRTGAGRSPEGSKAVDAGGGASVPGRSPASEEEEESRGYWIHCRVNPDVATKWYVALEIARRQAGHDVAAASMLEAAMAEFMTEMGFDALAQAEAEEAATRAAVEKVAEAACRVAVAVAACANLAPPALSGLFLATSERTVSASRGVQWEAETGDVSPEDPSEEEADRRRIEDDLAEFSTITGRISRGAFRPCDCLPTWSGRPRN